MRIVLLAMLCAGCTSVVPFVEGGLGSSMETGYYGTIDETGTAGFLSTGVEFDERWYLPTECGFYHRSMISKSPEIVVNDWACKKRIRFGGKNAPE